MSDITIILDLPFDNGILLSSMKTPCATTTSKGDSSNYPPKVRQPPKPLNLKVTNTTLEKVERKNFEQTIED